MATTRPPAKPTVRLNCPKCGELQVIALDSTRSYCGNCEALISAAGIAGVSIVGVRLSWGDMARLMLQAGLLSIPIAIVIFLAYFGLGALMGAAVIVGSH